MGEVNFLEGLFDPKILKILKLFFREREATYYLREISRNTGVSLASTYRIVAKLVRLEIVEQIRIKKFKLYKLGQNKKVSFLEDFIKEDKRIIDSFVEQAKAIEGVESVILHGDPKPERANVLLIGENVDANEIKRICASLKERYNFTISSLTLTQEQFTQMTNMGLYSGKKRALFKKS
jgi:hypothetical protein